MEEKVEVNDVVQELNDISKNVGTMGFSIKYTATPGNMKVHKAFKQYAFDNANNEYLLAIGKLLEYYDLFRFLVALDERVAELEKQMKLMSEVKVEEPKKEDKKKVF
jgi:ADP-glucose pyrophosphorylase